MRAAATVPVGFRGAVEDNYTPLIIRWFVVGFPPVLESPRVVMVLISRD